MFIEFNKNGMALIAEGEQKEGGVRIILFDKPEQKEIALWLSEQETIAFAECLKTAACKKPQP